MDDLISKQKLIDNLKKRKEVLEMSLAMLGNQAVSLMAEYNHNIQDVPQEKIFEGMQIAGDIERTIQFIDRAIWLIESIPVESLV